MLQKQKSLGVVLLVGWLFMTFTLKGQTTYDIRLAFSHYDTLVNVAHYEVQLRSSNNVTWGLAGQNYRLYYDSAKANFKEGTSKLPSTYQNFNLVQHVNKVDASSVNGNIEFAKNLGFINFAIDLNDTYNGGIFLPENGDWVTTAILSFEIACAMPENCMQTIWARDGKTNTYATSFVEISVWEEKNVTKSTLGNNFFDISLMLSKKSIKIRTFLLGAYEESTGLMRDDLRKKGYLPLGEPYSAITKLDKSLAFESIKNEKVKANSAIFSDKGQHSIVDWILVEIRNVDNPSTVEFSKVGLLQRDGYIINVEDNNPISFEGLPDQFYIAIRHRNHLGVMSQELLNKDLEMVDFTSIDLKTYGNYARKKLERTMLLWTGNADSNQFLSFQGGGLADSDVSTVLWEVLSDSNNPKRLLNHVKFGYHNADVNMDGSVKYSGPKNDIFPIFLSIIQHPLNHLSLSNYLVQEKLPK